MVVDVVVASARPKPQGDPSRPPPHAHHQPPQRPPPAVPRHRARSARRARGVGLVLLVDDSRVSLKVMRKVLGSSIFHLNIKEVCTGVAAAARFNFEAFDVAAI